MALSEGYQLPSSSSSEVKGEENPDHRIEKENFDPAEELRRLKVCSPATVLTFKNIVQVKREKTVPVIYEEIEDKSVPGSKKRKIEVVDLT
jgi:hypothetical protein